MKKTIKVNALQKINKAENNTGETERIVAAKIDLLKKEISR